MSRPTRNASIIASQRISKILKPLRNSFENLTVDESPSNEVVVEAVVQTKSHVHTQVEESEIPVEVARPLEEPPVEVHQVNSVVEKKDWSKTDSDSYEHSADYIGMIRYIRLKMVKASQADMVTNQQAIQDIFQALILSPQCLVKCVSLRNTIIEQMDEMEKTIASQWKTLQSRKMDDELWSLKSELYRIVQHPSIRNQINNHMSDILQLYNNYSEFLKRNELLQSIYNLRQILKELESLPGYVHAPSN